MKDKNFSYIVTTINIVLFFIIAIFIAKINSVYTKYEAKIDELKQVEQEINDYINSLEKVSPEVKIAVYIKDMSTGFCVKNNSEVLIPAASVVKVPIMAAVYYLVEKGELSLDEVIVYKKHHRCGGSGIIKNLPYGTKFKIKELLELMITISDNIATNMLTERIGFKKLNEIFRNLGLKATNIDRYIMDLKSRTKGIENYTTAEDIGLLLEKIYKGRLVSRKSSIEMLSLLMKQKISDRIPKKLPEHIVVAHKTGLMKNVCHDAGIVFTNNGDFVICVLTENMNHKIAKNVIAEIAYKTYCMYSKEYRNLVRSNNERSITNNSSWRGAGDN